MFDMKDKGSKTNAVRALDAAGATFAFRSFECDGVPSGLEVAKALGLDADRVFKTLVTEGKSGQYYVFMVPVAAELDLRKAARTVGEKAVHMIKSRDLLPLTGYVHGGCSPIGMKKPFPTVIDETAQLFATIFFSAGRIGTQLEMDPQELASLIDASFADIATT